MVGSNVSAFLESGPVSLPSDRRSEPAEGVLGHTNKREARVVGYGCLETGMGCSRAGCGRRRRRRRCSACPHLRASTTCGAGRSRPPQRFAHTDAGEAVLGGKGQTVCCERRSRGERGPAAQLRRRGRLSAGTRAARTLGSAQATSSMPHAAQAPDCTLHPPTPLRPGRLLPPSACAPSTTQSAASPPAWVS